MFACVLSAGSAHCRHHTSLGSLIPTPGLAVGFHTASDKIWGLEKAGYEARSQCSLSLSLQVGGGGCGYGCIVMDTSPLPSPPISPPRAALARDRDHLCSHGNHPSHTHLHAYYIGKMHNSKLHFWFNYSDPQCACNVSRQSCDLL